MKKKNTALFSALLIATNLLTACSSTTGVTGDKLLSQSNGHLIVQSNVDMTDTNVNSQTSGRIKEVKVKEGENVKKGQVLITIDSDSLSAQQAQIQAQIDTIKSQLNSAIAARNVRAAALEKAQNGARPEEISQAKAAYELQQSTYNRVKTLYDQGFSTKADLDNATSQLEISKSKYELTQNGSRPEDIKSAQADLDQANSAIETVQGQLRQAEASLQGLNVNINNATITAPTDGVVTQLNVESGELVSIGMPLIVITDSSTSSILCNVKETDLSKVKLDQVVSIKIPAYSDKSFKGKVVRINKNADFAVKRATNDNGEFDVLSYGVKVEITDLDKPLNAGMTVFVDFGKK